MTKTSSPRDTDLYIEALGIYAQTGNIAMTHRILEERGYVLSEGTIRNWYKENHDDWGTSRKLYIKQLADSKLLSQNFLEKELINFKDTKEIIDQKIKVIMGSDDVKLNDINQCLNALEKAGSYLLRIAKEKNKEKEDTDPYLKALTKILLAHPRIGPIFKEEKEAIQAAIKRELKRLKKD